MNFKLYRIGDLCSLVKGAYPTMKTEPGEYPFVVTAEYRRSASTYQLEGPAVCVPLISSTGHGDAALHRVHYQDGKFALANLLVALLPKDPGLCNAKYLYHLLMAKKDDLFVPLMLGTANVSLKQRDIAGVEIPLPPLSEQRRIVKRIEELADRIKEARGLRREAMEEAEALRASALAEIADAYQNSMDFLGSAIVSARNGLSRRPSGNEDGPVVLRLADVSEGIVSLKQPRRGRLSEEEIGKYGLAAGDLLFVRVNGSRDIVGRCVPFPGASETVCFNDHLIRVRLNPEVLDSGFAKAMANAPLGRDYIRRTAITTAGQMTINQKMLAGLPMPIPSLSEQRYLIGYLNDLQMKADSLKKMQAATAADLDALLPSMLDRALKGQL